MTTLTVSNAELLYMLEKKGYEIKITQHGDTKDVQFDGQFAKFPHKIHSYQADAWDDHAIRLDCVNRLLSWSGLHFAVTLDH